MDTEFGSRNENHEENSRLYWLSIKGIKYTIKHFKFFVANQM
jgi:hypothetical protein